MKKSLWERIKHPGAAVAVAVVLLTIALIAGTIVCLVRQYTGVFSYVLYVGAAIGLSYTVFLLVRGGIPATKAFLLAWACRHKFTAHLVEDYGFRTLIFATLSFAVNVGYALFEGVMGILSHSIWYGSLAAYYILLSLIRGFIVIREHRKSAAKEGERAALTRKLKTYRGCGISLMVLDVAMCVAVTQMVLSEHTVSHEGMMILVIAMYTFYKAIMAVTNLVKASRIKDPIVLSLRDINIADALISVISLETAMLAAFGQGEDMRILQAITGFFVCALTIVLGVVMVIQANRRLKALASAPAAEECIREVNEHE